MSRLAAEQWGVVSLAELRDCGLTNRAISVRARQGRLHRIHRGVYAVGHLGLPREGVFLAAVKACGAEAVLSHFSAAAHWGLIDWDGRRPEVTVPGAGRPAHPGLLVHRSRTLLPRDVLSAGAIPVTSPTRTLVDIAARLDYRALRRTVRQAQSLRLCNLGQLTETVSRAGPRRGIRKLARILATGPAPTRSVLEDAVLELIVGGGLAQPDVNVALLLGGRRVIPDFRWSEQGLVVEADGAAWHASRLAREDDVERQALLEAHGERVLRVTWEQAMMRPGEVLARIRAAGAPSTDRVAT